MHRSMTDVRVQVPGIRRRGEPGRGGLVRGVVCARAQELAQELGPQERAQLEPRSTRGARTGSEG